MPDADFNPAYPQSGTKITVTELILVTGFD
jgi:hypothetical protein